MDGGESVKEKGQKVRERVEEEDEGWMEKGR